MSVVNIDLDLSETDKKELSKTHLKSINRRKVRKSCHSISRNWNRTGDDLMYESGIERAISTLDSKQNGMKTTAKANAETAI